MSSPLLDQKTNLVSKKVFFDGKELSEEHQIVHIEVEYHINKLPYALIEFLDGDMAGQKMPGMDKLNLEPGMSVKIEAGYNQNNEVIFEGIISAVGYESDSSKHGLTQVECTDTCIALTLTNDNEYFENKKDSEIVSKIISTYDNIKKEIEGTKTVHPKIVQYNASDWDFLLARAKVNQRIVVVERNTYKFIEPGNGGNETTLVYGQDINHFKLDIDAKNQRKSIIVKSWDSSNHTFKEASSKEPKFDKQGSDAVKGPNLADKMQYKEEVLYASSQLQDSELKDIAASQLLYNRLGRVKGELEMQGYAKLKVNSFITLQKVHKTYAGDVYVSGVVHVMEQGNFLTRAIIGLDTASFDSENIKGTTQDNLGLLPGPRGIFIGEVTKMDSDPDGDFRVQVKIPTFKESDDGLWAKLATTYAGKKGGFVWYPEIGDQVVVGFIMNDPRYPIVLGSIYSKKHSVFNDHQPKSGNDQKAIVTRSGMKVLFEEDKKDITLITPNENFIKIKDSNKSIHLEDQHGNKIVMDSKGISITSIKDFKVEARGKIDMEAIGNFSAEGKNIKIEAKMSSAFTSGTKAELKGTNVNVKANGIGTIKAKLLKLN